MHKIDRTTAVVKFPWLYRRSYFVKQNKKRHSIHVGWSILWCFWHCSFLIGNFVMVDSP